MYAYNNSKYLGHKFTWVVGPSDFYSLCVIPTEGSISNISF
jgi:hypothetical protein